MPVLCANFSETVQPFLLKIADGLDAMKLFDSQSSLRGSARDAGLTAINFVADAINRSVDLREIATNALHALTAVTHLEAGAVYLWDDDKDVLQLHSSHGIPAALSQQLARLKRDEPGPVMDVMDGKTCVVNNLLKTAGHGQFHVIAQAGYQSAIFCPVSAQGFVAGLLVLATKDRQRFESEDVGVIEVICNQLGNALIHAQLEGAARASQEHYRLLVEHSDDAIYITGAEMQPRYANSAFERVFGYQANELAALDQYERIHQADAAMVRNAHTWLVQGKAIRNMEYRFCRKDGQWVVLQCNAGILARTGNETGEFQFVVRDVSETHRRQQQLIRRNSQLTALSTLAAVANSSLKLDDIARNTLQVALESTGTEAGGIHLIEADRKRMQLYVHIGLPAELAEIMRELTVGEGLAGNVAASGEVTVFTEGPMNKFGYNMLVAVPVKTRGETLGVLTMVSQQDLQFGADVIKMLTAMGHQLGSVIANVQLYEAQLRENEKLTALLAISGGDAQALELDSLLSRILHQAAGLLRADAAYIVRYNGAQAKVVAATTRLNKLVGAEFPANIGLSGQLSAYRYGRIFSKNEIRHAVNSPLLQQIEPHSVLLVPLFAREASLGTLGLIRETSSAIDFTSTDLELMSAFAGRAAVAIDTAQLLHELSQKNEQLELLIEEAHHRIKNSLQMVSGLLQLESIDNPAIAPAIARIQAIAKVHNLLSREMPDNVNAGALITAILDTLKASATGAWQTQLDLQEVWLTPDQATALSLIVNELVSNALKHSKPVDGTPLQLVVHCRQDNGIVWIQISDNGGGLPPGFDWQQSTRQGMSIIRQLTRTNLRGEINLANRDSGLCAELKFNSTAAGPATRA